MFSSRVAPSTVKAVLVMVALAAALLACVKSARADETGTHFSGAVKMAPARPQGTVATPPASSPNAREDAAHAARLMAATLVCAPAIVSATGARVSYCVPSVVAK